MYHKTQNRSGRGYTAIKVHKVRNRMDKEITTNFLLAYVTLLTLANRDDHLFSLPYT